MVCVYGSFPALAGADFQLSAGEVVHAHGPNGAGKTTLLRLISGFLSPARGAARVGPHDLSTISGRRGARSAVAYVGTEPLAYDDLTVTENLEFLVGSSADATVERSMDSFGLREIAEQRVRACSTGQRKRLGLAAGFSRRRSLIVLDEPHAGLDDEGRTMLDEAIQSAADDGIAVVMVSHEREFARATATRSVLVSNGIVAHG